MSYCKNKFAIAFYFWFNIKNNYYFSKISDNLPNISNVEEDIETIPDGVQKNQKNYNLISFNDEILGVVDYLTDYPEKEI